MLKPLAKSSLFVTAKIGCAIPLLATTLAAKPDIVIATTFVIGKKSHKFLMASAVPLLSNAIKL